MSLPKNQTMQIVFDFPELAKHEGEAEFIDEFGRTVYEPKSAFNDICRKSSKDLGIKLLKDSPFKTNGPTIALNMDICDKVKNDNTVVIKDQILLNILMNLKAFIVREMLSEAETFVENMNYNCEPNIIYYQNLIAAIKTVINENSNIGWVNTDEWLEKCQKILDRMELKKKEMPLGRLEELKKKYPKQAKYFNTALEKQVEAFGNNKEQADSFFKAAEAFLNAIDETDKAEEVKAANNDSKSKKCYRAAVVFGNFDPFHNGHMNLANRILKQKKADKVVFVPLGHEKIFIDGLEDERDNPRAGYTTRYTMIAKVIHDNYLYPNFDVLSLEDICSSGGVNIADIDDLTEDGRMTIDIDQFMPLLEETLEKKTNTNYKLFIVETLPDLVGDSKYYSNVFEMKKAEFNLSLWKKYDVIFVPPWKTFIGKFPDCSKKWAALICGKDELENWLKNQTPPVKDKLKANMLDVSKYDALFENSVEKDYRSTDCICSSYLRFKIGAHIDVSNEVPKEVYQMIICKHLYF